MKKPRPAAEEPQPRKTIRADKAPTTGYSLVVDGTLNQDAVWYYADPKPEAESVRGRVAFWKGVKVEA